VRIAESNIRFGRMMQDMTHYKHAIQNIRNTLTIEKGYDVWKLPVCEKCEGYALWHNDGGQKVGSCFKCGHTTRNPITVQEYYERGYAVDQTGLGRDQPLIVDREIINPKDVATIYRGDVRMDNPDRKIIIAR